MSKLPDRYNPQETEKKQQNFWSQKQVYKWQNDLPKNQTFVIDTPPPTVSGVLHMGHIFSYTQADFVARYKRMRGFDVFYPMGFDDNGLPTERLVEKTIGKKAGVYEAENGRGSFVRECQKIVDDAEVEFENLFNTIALSVDWDQKYQTISAESQQISQASFVDLFNKGLVERRFAPVLWDCVDRTALSQADLVDKEMPSVMYDIEFGVECDSENKDWIVESGLKPAPRNDGVSSSDSKFLTSPPRNDLSSSDSKFLTSLRNDGVEDLELELETPSLRGSLASLSDAAIQNADEGKITIATTRPELLPACVAVMIHPEDEKYKHLIKQKLNQENEGFTGSYAITALFGVKVPIIADKLVQMEKGTGAVMCCTFGDETDIKWWQKHRLPIRAMVSPNGKLCNLHYSTVGGVISDYHFYYIDDKKNSHVETSTQKGFFNSANCLDLEEFKQNYKNIILGESGKNTKQAREALIEELKNKNLLIKSENISHAVKCAERSGAPIEILVQNQWYIKILDKKEQLKAKANECNWYPEFMKIRVEQWIDNLAWDWCISRQRYFGVPFPIWYSKRKGEEGKILIADFNQLPIDPQKDLPAGYSKDEVEAETDIMDTWATSSISPQLSSKGISEDFCIDKQRHNKLFPADLRPQAHEIIRTWAFYTLVKAMLHQDKIPWKNLMISGWCLAADKTKMSKSKGNVITPQSLIEEKGADVVRYWASASNLGADIAYSEELFKIGGKLITKLFNASKFVAQNFADLTSKPTTAKLDVEKNIINEKSDLWILSRLQQTIARVEYEFDGSSPLSKGESGCASDSEHRTKEKSGCASDSEYRTRGLHAFEYAKSRQAIEDFFWNDFCDNYLEIVKVRSYGLGAEKYKDMNLSDAQKTQIIAGQQSGLFTLYHCLEALLKLFSPFIPHITEELYQAIFPNKLTSIHQRGSWCKLEECVVDKQALELGGLMLEVIFNIRKFKSDNNLSMKTPIQQFCINTKIDISAIVFDLQNVCNTAQIITNFNSEESQLVLDVKMV